MDRRDLLRLVASVSALPFLPGTAEAASLARAIRHAAALTPRALSTGQQHLVSVLADLILPRTDTPGATDVGVTPFIDHLLADWFPEDERRQFLAGLDDLDRRAVAQYRSSFLALDPDTQMALVSALDGATGSPGSAEATFSRLKSLTVYGYFTAEAVARDILRDPIKPGRFEGCIPWP
jgi:hypothetical protein